MSSPLQAAHMQILISVCRERPESSACHCLVAFLSLAHPLQRAVQDDQPDTQHNPLSHGEDMTELGPLTSVGANEGVGRPLICCAAA